MEKTQTGQDEFKLNSKKMQLGRMLAYFKRYWPQMLLGFILAVLINLVALAKPYILKIVIDNYLVPMKPDLGALFGLGIGYYTLMIIGSASGYAQALLLTLVGQKIMHTIRMDLFKHIQKMSMGFFDRNSSGRILTRLTNDVEALNEIYSGVIVTMFKDAVLVIGIFVTMFIMDPGLALISLTCIPFILATTMAYRIAARKNFIKIKATIARINAFLAENIQGMKLVQMFNRQLQKLHELKELDREYFRYNIIEVILNCLGRPLVDIINNITIAVIIWAGVWEITGRSLQIGVLFAFITYIKQIFEPIGNIAETYTGLQSAVVSSERIFDMMDNTADQEVLDKGAPADSVKGRIEFEDVWFAYRGEDWILKGVSFTIEPGRMVAFVGETGSGKSTIINLISGFYFVQKGRVLIDGIDVKEYNLTDLRRKISVVQQDVFLFAGDIKSNIRLRDAGVSDEQIKEAVCAICADRFIEGLPGGYDEPVMERGSTLSAGQRQLIAFARAMVRRPPIIVLDEATANIDTETEMAIQRVIGNKSGETTMIVVAHRLSTVRSADIIMAVKEGVIAERGCHEDLLKLGGIYAGLYESHELTDSIEGEPGPV